MADNWGQMSYRIQQTVNSQAEYNTVMARTAASARETSRDVDEVRELYLQVGESIQGLGYSLLESMDLTDSFSLLLKTNSASAEESAAATNAYAAALQKGSVDAKDWETMLAAMPSLVDQVADSTSMSAEEIKRLGSEGKLALQDINQGMFDSLESTRALSTEMPDTVRGALTNVMSGLKDFVGAQNEAFGVTQVLAGGLNLLAGHIDVVGKVAAAVGVVMGARYVASLQSSAGAIVYPPIEITDARLLASSVPEPDVANGEQAWQSGQAYAAGATVIRANVHKRYQALAAIAAGDTATPESSPLKWQDIRHNRTSVGYQRGRQEPDCRDGAGLHVRPGCRAGIYERPNKSAHVRHRDCIQRVIRRAVCDC